MYPAPRENLSAPDAWSAVFTVLCVALFCMAVAWVIRLALRGETLGIFFLAAGLVMGLLEP